MSNSRRGNSNKKFLFEKNIFICIITAQGRTG